MTITAEAIHGWPDPPWAGWRDQHGTAPDGAAGWALFGWPGAYRYALRRTWRTGPVLAMALLNPSTAGAARNDQTVRQGCAFAAREGCGGLLVVNLFGMIATHPGALVGIRVAQGMDPVGGPINDWAITQAVREARDSGGKVVLGWGTNADRFPQRAGEVLGLVYREGVTPWALGFTASGQPRHPARLAHDTPLLAMPF